MGLDMYLDGEVYIFGNEARLRRIENVDLPDLPVKTIGFRLGYWRKANQIHNWFVNNVCEEETGTQRAYVSKDKMEELKGLVEQVLSYEGKTEFKEKAEELLPTCSGFFFGSEEYDEGYLIDLKETKDILEKAIEIHDKYGADIYYSASW